MTATDPGVFPAGFADLAPFARIWGDFADPAARYAYRQTCAMAELAAFHAAVAPRLEAIFAHLDGFAVETLPAAEARLFRTALGVIEAAEAIEFFGQPRMAGAPFPHVVTQEMGPPRG